MFVARAARLSGLRNDVNASFWRHRYEEAWRGTKGGGRFDGVDGGRKKKRKKRGGMLQWT